MPSAKFGIPGYIPLRYIRDDAGDDDAHCHFRME